ncbi:MAG TPA: dienelactone hydrolase family protein [Chloroflexota bacterium]|nr:dienelactone hydrolase family protein [Chloroflexota bacterium]
MNDMQRYLVEEMVEAYEEGRLSRRELLRRVTLMTGSAVVASTFLAAARPPAATAAPVARPAAQMTSPTDPDLEAGMVDYPGQGATLRGYQARPKGDQVHAGIVLIHENRGLTPHQQDVARRLAKEGYVALAVDLLSREGGTAAFPDTAAAMGAQAQLPPEQMIGDLNSAVAYLQSLPYVRASSIGAMGHCFGGGMTWRLATVNPNLKAAVPFYGPAPPLDAVPNIQAAVLGIYAGDDPRIDAGIPDLVAALTAAGKTFEIEVYPGVQHAFFNDTGQSYNADAARAAWQRALGWFNTYLNA